MATAQRQPDPLVGELERRGPRFGFFQAVQLIHRLFPDAVRIGELGPPELEAIRFRHDPNLVFHTSDISGVRVESRRDEGIRLEITTSFLGLIGPVSPLATVFSEDVLNAEWRDETSLRSFYDLLHHRLISLFFRAWHKHRFYATFRSDLSDSFSRRMLTLVGVDLAGATPRRGLAPIDLLALAPLVAGRSRPARTLQIVLERMVRTGVSIEQFVARRVRVPDDQRFLLGRQNCELAVDLALGRSVTDRSGRFRVVLGPVDYPTFEALMPGGSRHAQLRDVIMQFSPVHLEAEVELFLGADQAPRFQLGRDRGAVLGVTTQLAARTRKPMRARIILSDNPGETTARLLSDEETADTGTGRDAAVAVV
jgi:type VI secretion system protein ImpH